MATSTVAYRARIVWFMRLSSAIRTASACAIVGSASIYGPKFLSHQIKFSAFSYLTAVLIVSDAALGDTVRGCWHAFCATLLVVPLAMLWRWVVAPSGGLPVSVASAAVAVAAFVVALPEWIHLTAKRIAFGQIVLVCTDAVLSDGCMRPLYVAASTALGALASVVALLLPFPGQASYEVQKLYQVYTENASQGMKIYLRGLYAMDRRTKMELLSQVKPLSETGAKLLQSIRILEEGMQWERPWRQLGRGERLERMELQMRGLEYSLVHSYPSFPIQEIGEEEVSNFIQGMSDRMKEKMEQVTSFSPPHSMTESETREFMEKPSLPLESTLMIHKLGWVAFYFSCIDMFLSDNFAISEKVKTNHPTTKLSIIITFKNWIKKLTNHKRLEFAFKSSLSLSLAVLLGLIFDKENGCWAGLTIAISVVTERQAILTIANSRAQGTAIGSVYGVICCFLFHHEEIRLIALLPWTIFTCFLRHSKMYGQTGGVSAAIGALLILGRKNYGVPNEFAIARLTEVFIGLSAFIMVELFLQPVRTATLAKNHLFVTLHALQGCIQETGNCPLLTNLTLTKFLDLKENQRNLNSLICELKKIVADAELEPDFWCLPFRSSCYQKLVENLSNIRDMLYFITCNIEKISELSEATAISREFEKQIINELRIYQEILSSSQVVYPKQAISSESQANTQDASAGNSRDVEEGILDVEEGILQNTAKVTVSIAGQLEEEWKTTQYEETDENKKLKDMMIQCLNATGFCISSLMRELEDINIYTREIDQWDNQRSFLFRSGEAKLTQSM